MGKRLLESSSVELVRVGDDIFHAAFGLFEERPDKRYSRHGDKADPEGPSGRPCGRFRRASWWNPRSGECVATGASWASTRRRSQRSRVRGAASPDFGPEERWKPGFVAQVPSEPFSDARMGGELRGCRTRHRANAGIVDRKLGCGPRRRGGRVGKLIRGVDRRAE